MKSESFIEVSPLFGSFDGRTGRVLSFLPEVVRSVEYSDGKLRFYFSEMPDVIPNFLQEMYPHGSFRRLSYGKK